MNSSDWRTQAKTARSKGEIHDALRFYIEAMAASQKAGDVATLMHDTRHAADLHRELGNFDEAYVLICTVLGYYRQNPTSSLELANALRIAALVNEAYEDDGTEAAFWQEARNLYESVGVEAGVAEAERHLARLTVN